LAAQKRKATANKIALTNSLGAGSAHALLEEVSNRDHRKGKHAKKAMRFGRKNLRIVLL
jgi:hypothetical protein